MAVVFSEFNLPPIPSINSYLKETEIRKWKDNLVVKGCFKRLLKKIKKDEPETYMSRIIQTLHKRKVVSKIQIAYAISVCEVLLNPNNLHIQVSEPVIKSSLAKNLVSIQYLKFVKKYHKYLNYYFFFQEKITGNENFLSNSDDDEVEEVEEQLQKADKSESIKEATDDVEGEVEADDYQGSTDDEMREKLKELKKQYKKK